MEKVFDQYFEKQVSVFKCVFDLLVDFIIIAYKNWQLLKMSVAGK